MKGNGPKLNLSGAPRAGWETLPSRPATEILPQLSHFAAASFAQVHGWHVLNKLDGNRQIALLRDCRRILRPGGVFTGAVPDMDVLCRMFVSLPDTGLRMAIAAMIYGDHSSALEINHFGFNADIIPVVFGFAQFGPVSLGRRPGLFEHDPETLIDGICVDLSFVAEV